MDIRFPEPLHPETWFSRLQKLADLVDDLDNAESEMMIRQAFHIVHLTPAPLRHLFKTDLDDAELEGLLRCEAYESAIFRLLGPPLALEISRGLHSDDVHAKIEIDDGEVCGGGAHPNVTKASIAAWTKCLVKLSDVARSEDHASNPA